MIDRKTTALVIALMPAMACVQLPPWVNRHEAIQTARRVT